MKIAGNTFLVTGGGSGLGAACARRLVEREAKVVIADMNQAQGLSLADRLGPQALFVETDVTDEAAVARAIAVAQENFGGLAGVVQCAGIIAGARVVGREGPHDLALFAKIVQVNLIGTFNVLRLAAAAMSQQAPDEEQERGVIINTSSISAFEGQIGQAAYSASKGGVAAMTLPIARELARFGIRVMAVAPGTFETPMVAQMTPELRKSLESQVPFPARLGRPEEFAALVEHIIENRMLNGEVIRIDGAVRFGPK
jgi:NAD(P)-dependent dehydrogenase (short-subunit alcohol dehydrogenase family)